MKQDIGFRFWNRLRIELRTRFWTKVKIHLFILRASFPTKINTIFIKKENVEKACCIECNAELSIKGWNYWSATSSSEYEPFICTFY